MSYIRLLPERIKLFILRPIGCVEDSIADATLTTFHANHSSHCQ